MKENNKKRLLLLSSLLLLLSCSSVEYKYEPVYEILDTSDDAFARYSNGRVFIGNEGYLKGLTGLSKGDILVEDLRDRSDPDFKIYDSYRIIDANQRNEILQILSKYEEYYPSNWNRTLESMSIEWFAHNMSYFFYYQPHRTTDVDLNNDDESLYNGDFFKKLIK